MNTSSNTIKFIYSKFSIASNVISTSPTHKPDQRVELTFIKVWRQWLTPYCTADTSVLEATVEHGDSAPIPHATPSIGPYVTRGLCVVDRTLGACPATCSSRHLTFHFSHTYISTRSLHSHWLFPFWRVLGLSRLRAWTNRDNERVDILSSYTSWLRPRPTIAYCI